MPVKSVRDLARILGLSHTTVSDALRDSPRVRKATRERVLEAAREAGYNYNPLAGALMSEMRRSTVGTFRGVLAVVDLECDDEREAGPKLYHHEIFEGATEASNKLGFQTARFVLGGSNMRVQRLGSVLESRGIRGLVILPSARSPVVGDLHWELFAGVYTDYVIEHPAINSVTVDHYRSMVFALQKLLTLGYKRPGLVLHDDHDRRLLHRWEAAYRAYVMHDPHMEYVEPLIYPYLDRDDFCEWFQFQQPDVVMSHRGEILEWMTECGARIPETHGYCALNVTYCTASTSGIDLQPRIIGSKAAQLLIAQLHRNEYGIPAVPSTTHIPAAWRSGNTIREKG